jgi:hypothetical protein
MTTCCSGAGSKAALSFALLHADGAETAVMLMDVLHGEAQGPIAVDLSQGAAACSSSEAAGCQPALVADFPPQVWVALVSSAEPCWLTPYITPCSPSAAVILGLDAMLGLQLPGFVFPVSR